MAVVTWELLALGDDGRKGRCRYVGRDAEGWHFRCVLDEDHEGDHLRRLPVAPAETRRAA